MRIRRFAALFALLSFNATAADSEWIRIRTANFEVYSSAGERSARETLDNFELVRSFFAQLMGSGSLGTQPVRVLVFGSRREYEAHRVNAIADAYYHGTPEGESVVMSQTGADAFPIAVHEYAHLFFAHSQWNLPPWLNEGLAELYSTLRPEGDRVVVGAGRPRVEKWTPLAVILAAGKESPYYLERDKAASLYNQGWTLVHMLSMSPAYAPKFAQVLAEVRGGARSQEVLTRIYGRTLAQIESDTQAYLRRERFNGVTLPVKLQHNESSASAEPAASIDVKLALAELENQPGREEASRRNFEMLATEAPSRPEPHVTLGFLAWKQSQSNLAQSNLAQRNLARDEFRKAFELGSLNPAMLWHLGRVEAIENPAFAIRVLNRLLTQEPERVDVRLQLAALQLNSDARGALATIAMLREIGEQDQSKFFTISAYAHWRTGNPAEARSAAERAARTAHSAEDMAEAERVRRFLAEKIGAP
jgi:hypothetical protein